MPDKEKVNVCFRKVGSGAFEGDIIAFIDGYDCNPGCVMSYEHVGQHGEASVDLLDELKPALAHEYDDLLKELESIGYVVTVVNDIRKD